MSIRPDSNRCGFCGAPSGTPCDSVAHRMIGAPLKAEQPTPWREVHLYSMEKHELGKAIGAIMEHLGCTLVSRWEPGNGIVFAAKPKALSPGIGWSRQ